MIVPVPELFDGGYWYVLPVVYEEEEGNIVRTAGNLGTGWCAWYGELNEEEYVLVRTIKPVPIQSSLNIKPENIFNFINKPFARLKTR